MATDPAESAEAFVARVQEDCTGHDSDTMVARWLVQQRARDRAIRAEALMTGLRERAGELRGRAAGYLDPDQRKLVEDGWERDAQAFDRYAQELIPCSALADEAPRG